MYNHKTITFDSLFLHRVKRQFTSIILYSQHTDKSIHILSLFRQNIQTNHEQNMQHSEHKVSDNYSNGIDFFPPPSCCCCCFNCILDMVAHIVIGRQHIVLFFFYSTVNSSYTTMLYNKSFFVNTHMLQTSDNINIQPW